MSFNKAMYRADLYYRIKQYFGISPFENSKFVGDEIYWQKIVEKYGEATVQETVAKIVPQRLDK